METKPIALRSVPDVGQDYWVKSSRIEYCRLSSTALHVAGVILLAATATVSGYMAVRVGSHHLLFPCALLVIIIAGTIALFFACLMLADAYDQRRWKKDLPPKPEGYVPELAETARYLEGKIEMREDFIRRRAELDEGLALLSEEIEEGFAYIEDARQVMAEDDIDTLTLRS